jgi:hypothetical protein
MLASTHDFAIRQMEATKSDKTTVVRSTMEGYYRKRTLLRTS